MFPNSARRNTESGPSRHTASSSESRPQDQGASSRRSNAMNAHDGVSTSHNHMRRRQHQGYGNATPSSNARDDHVRSYSMPLLTESISRASTVLPSPAVQALVAAGGITVSITEERERANADPARPAFLHGIILDRANPDEWQETVLPVVREMTFTLNSTVDIHYTSSMFASSDLNSLFLNVTKVEFPRLYWFSGVGDNRAHNPYFKFAIALRNLEQLTFTMHTAAITVSRFGERHMLLIEATNPRRAKERKTMSLEEVVDKYELNAVFACIRLQRIRIEYIDCEMTAHFTKVGDPMELMREVQSFIAGGFSRGGMNVLVELVRVN